MTTTSIPSLAPGPRKSRAARQRLWGVLLPVISLAALVLIWHAVSVSGAVSPVALPTLEATGRAAVRLWSSGVLLSATMITLGRVLIAFVLGVLVGSAIGIAMGRIPWIDALLRPLVRFTFPVPKIALYPAIIAVVGIGAESKVLLGFTEAVFPVILAAAAGASQINPRLIWATRSLERGPLSMLVGVIIPGALPSILTGARVSLVGTTIGVFLAEMIAGSDGLGQLASRSWVSIETPSLYVAILTIAIIGLVLDGLFLLARHRILRWEVLS